MPPENFDPVELALLRHDIDELVMKHAFDCGVNQDFEDLDKPSTTTLGGFIDDVESHFGDSTIRTTSVYQRIGESGLKKSLMLFRSHLPTSSLMERFLLTPENLTHCDGKNTPVDEDDTMFIRYLLAITVWDSQRSAALARDEHLSRVIVM